jgi:hypothetical protein
MTKTAKNLQIVAGLYSIIADAEYTIRTNNDNFRMVLRSIDRTVDATVWECIEQDSPFWAIRSEWTLVFDIADREAFCVEQALNQIKVVQSGLRCLEAGLRGKF